MDNEEVKYELMEVYQTKLDCEIMKTEEHYQLWHSHHLGSVPTIAGS